MTDRPLAYWLALASRMMEERFTAVLNKHGVSRTQWRILSLLVRGPATGGELANFIDQMPANPFGESGPTELSELVAGGWVEAGDRYSVTERGASAYDRLADDVDEMRELMVQGVTAEDKATMMLVLEKMAGNFGWVG